jgi:hypothetical protein
VHYSNLGSRVRVALDFVVRIVLLVAMVKGSQPRLGKLARAQALANKHARAESAVLHKKTKKPPRMSPDEKRLVREMHFDRGMAPVDIATSLGRNISSICRLLAQKKAPNPNGRRACLSKEQVDKAEKVLNKMIDAADACEEVTLAMVKKRCRFKCCDRVMFNALHARGYWFRTLRKKMILTPDDVKTRYKWSIQYKGKSKKWWLKRIHVHLDNKHFKAAVTVFGRRLLAKRKCRGVYRKKGKSLRSGHVKPDPKLRLNTGTKGILKMGGVGGGRVLVWHTIVGHWSGAVAAKMYKEVVTKALKKRYRGTHGFTILEDNDPTGNLSKKAVEAKRKSKLHVLTIPKRSPDLNVLDFAIWTEVEKRLRVQEKAMSKDKRESREEFEKRLDRTARELPKVFIDKSIANLRERAQLLFEAKGGLFEEGGLSQRTKRARHSR